MPLIHFGQKQSQWEKKTNKKTTTKKTNLASPWALMREVKVHNLSFSCMLGTDIPLLAQAAPFITRNT